MKMAELAMLAGFDGVMVLKRGLEGSLSPSTSRASGLLCAVRKPDGHLFFQHFESDLPAFAPFKTDVETSHAHPTPTENAKLIRQFWEHNETGDADFNNRVRFAHALYGRGLTWIESQLP